ncbi:MAG: hydroxyisourate hydrolase [Phycisphaerales bacterium]
MSGISTHVLDVTKGVAAAGIALTLERAASAGAWTRIADARTDADGRVKSLLPAGTALAAGTYRLSFETGAYWKAAGFDSFHPRVEVTFTILDPTRHHHVPLLMSPYGYTTYRGT